MIALLKCEFGSSPIEENEILPSAGPTGNRLDLRAQSFQRCFIQIICIFIMRRHTDLLAFTLVRSWSFSCLDCVLPALFSPWHWASGGLREGFMWVGGPAGVQTLVQWMSRHCEGSVTRLHTEGSKIVKYKGGGSLYCRLFRESTSLGVYRTNMAQSW